MSGRFESLILLFNQLIDQFWLRVPGIPDWMGESRNRRNSPDSRADPRLEGISPRFLMIFEFSDKILHIYSYIRHNF
jgi:hypothetical protein